MLPYAGSHSVPLTQHPQEPLGHLPQPCQCLQALERLFLKKPHILPQPNHSCLMLRLGPKLRLTAPSAPGCSGARSFAIFLTVMAEYAQSYYTEGRITAFGSRFQGPQ